MSAIVNVLYFLIAMFFSLLTFVLWTRLALRYVFVSTLNPVSQSIYALTNPIIQPIEHLLPKKLRSNGRLKRYDWPAFITLVIVEFVKFILLVFLLFGQFIPISLLILYTLADLIIQPCNLLFYAIIIQVIISWVNPGWRHPIAEILTLITEPILSYTRKLVPTIGAFDFSPVLILILLKAITIFISNYLPVKGLL